MCAQCLSPLVPLVSTQACEILGCSKSLTTPLMATHSREEGGTNSTVRMGGCAEIMPFHRESPELSLAGSIAFI